MKCFDVVRMVLDETYGEIPGDKKTKDAKINTAMTAMSKQYKDHLMESGGPPFGDPITRFSYVLRYVPAHAHWLYDLLDGCDEAAAILESGRARVTCIGGGPGSDVVGLLKLLDEREIDCKLFCELIDGCEDWKTTWGDLAWQLDLDEALHTDYVIHDVGKPKSWKSPSKIHKADIVTLSFFVSEIYHLDQAEEYLTMMLGKLKAGAIVVMNDNKTPEVYTLMDKIAKAAGLKTIKSGKGENKIYDSGEDMDVIKDYTAKFGNSKLTGQCAWRIYKKP
jgi:hypothetical protein